MATGLELLEPRLLMSATYEFPSLWPDPKAEQAILAGLTTASSDAPIFLTGGVTPSATLATTPSGRLMNLDDFRADPRFSGIDGSGFSTVVIDTGIDLNHPFFGADTDGNGIADRIAYHYDFYGDLGDGNASDGHGHGSNVASIIASSDGTHSGVAPAANIIALKVFSDLGEGGTFGDIEEALRWTVANAPVYNIGSVNLSLGDDGNYTTSQSLYGLSDELSALSSLGVVVTAAAGNSFYGKKSQVGVSYPAADPNALAVSAVFGGNIGGVAYGDGSRAFTTNSDRVTPFSQRHSALTDVFAPGAPVTGATATGGTVTMHGTSQASPHVAGVALLMQELAVRELGRRLAPGEFTSLMRSSATTIRDGDDEDDNVTNTGLSFPRLDVLAFANAVMNLGGPRSQIAGTLFNDLDGDGTRDAGDGPLSGWAVYLDTNNNGRLDAVQRTFTATDAPKTISAVGASTITSQLNVGGLTAPIADVNVTLNISHTYDGDLDAFLIAPNGERIELFTGVGGAGDNFTNTTLDDQASTPITAGSAPFSGSFQPEGLLAALNGDNGNGGWKLEVRDNFALDGGSLNGWSLNIRTSEPTRTTDPAGNYAFTNLANGFYTVAEVVKSGWNQTFPTRVYTLNIVNGQDFNGINFGNKAATIDDVVVDNTSPAVSRVGSWSVSNTGWQGVYGANYLHDGFTRAGRSATFTADLKTDGRYAVYATWTKSPQGATNVPVTIQHRDGTASASVNQGINFGKWNPLGEYNFTAAGDGRVTISNNGANGYVIADAVRFVRVGDLTSTATTATAGASEADILAEAPRHGKHRKADPRQSARLTAAYLPEQSASLHRPGFSRFSLQMPWVQRLLSGDSDKKEHRSGGRVDLLDAL